MENSKEIEGLGGWLILVGIGVVITPLRLIHFVYTTYWPIFDQGIWSVLTDPSSESYHPLWGPLLLGEVVTNMALIIASFYLIFLFFTKRALFPKLYIGIVIVTLAFIPLDAWLAAFVLPNEPMFDPETIKEFVRTLIVALVWIPYMMVSKRVRVTFVNPNRIDKQIQPIAESGC